MQDELFSLGFLFFHEYLKAQRKRTHEATLPIPRPIDSCYWNEQTIRRGGVGGTSVPGESKGAEQEIGKRQKKWQRFGIAYRTKAQTQRRGERGSDRRTKMSGRLCLWVRSLQQQGGWRNAMGELSRFLWLLLGDRGISVVRTVVMHCHRKLLFETTDESTFQSVGVVMNQKRAATRALTSFMPSVLVVECGHCRLCWCCTVGQESKFCDKTQK